MGSAGHGYDTRVNLLLAKHGMDPDLKDSQFSRTPLSWAAKTVRSDAAVVGY